MHKLQSSKKLPPSEIPYRTKMPEGGKIVPRETEVIAKVFLFFIFGAFICPSESIAQKSCVIIKHFYQIIDYSDLKSSRRISSRQLGLRANSFQLRIAVQRGGKR